MKRAWILLLALTAGCGSRLFAPCDIRESACQQSLTNGLRELRNASAIEPTVLVRSEEEVIADSIVTTTPEQRAAFARQNGILALFELSLPGLTLEDQVQNRFDQVAAFYSSGSDQITVIDRGEPLDGIGPTLTFTHELVHAMQAADGFLALAAQNTDTTDRSLAHRAVTEGEATLFEDLAAFDLFGWDDDEHAEALAYYRAREAYLASLDELLIYNASFLFPYAFGTAYMRDIWDASGWPGIVDAYSSLPRATLTVIDGREPEELAGEAIAIPTADYVVAIADTFGAFIVRAWCASNGIAYCEYVYDDGFTGLVSNDGGRSVAIWRMRADGDWSEAIMRSAVEAGFYVRKVGGGDLVFVASNTGARVEYESVSVGWRAVDD